MNITFFGLGNMGEPMARNLLRAGHELTVFNRTRAKVAALEREGAAVADSPAQAVARADVLITMLADDRALRDTLFSGGAIDALPRSAVHMSASTISVAFSKTLAGEHGARGQGYVAATVLGRPEAAAAGKLWVMAAGPKAQVARCRPLMEAIGRGISVMGEEPWQANLSKIAANFMLSSLLESLGEAFALVRKSGLDPHAFLEVLNEVFASPVYASYGGKIADRSFEPAGFRLKLGLKDVGLALESAQDSAVPMPLASLVHDHYLSAVANGLQDSDWSALAKVSAWEAGLDG